MRDDRNMDALDVVVAELFGDAVDPREVRDVIAKANDASEMHVSKPLGTPDNPTKEQRRKYKRQAQIGLVSNVVGLTAGVAAAYGASRNPALRNKVIPAYYKGGPLTAKVAPYLKTDAGRARLYRVGAGGALAVQGGNTAGDIIANRVLDRESKKKVEKALGDVLLARRQGRITTEQAIDLSAEIVQKAVTPDSKAIHDAVDAIAPALPSKKVQMGLKAVNTIQQGAQAAQPAVQQGRRSGKKMLSFARKAMPQSITGTNAEPALSAVRKKGRVARYVANIAEETSRASSAAAAAEGARAAQQTISAAENSGKRLILLGAGGLTGATTLPVVASQGFKRYREKKNRQPLAKLLVPRAPKMKLAPALDKAGEKVFGPTHLTVKAKETVKKDDSPSVTWSGDISKRDDDKHQVFGFALVTHVDGEPVIDRQGDYTPLEEIEKSAYTYVIESRKGGDMHRRDGENPLHTSDLIESFVITPEKLSTMGLAEDALPHGWWVGFKVNDEQQWDDVKTGKRTSFSIHGRGVRKNLMMGV